MNFEETIQIGFDYYPDLFQRREQVLDQLFCTIGNGYDWVKGELVCPEDKKPINPLHNGKAKQYNIITKGIYRKNMYQDLINDKGSFELWTELLKNKGQTLEMKLLTPQDDDNELQYEIKHDVYPLSLNYSYLFNYPKNIKADWLQGIKETYEYIINNIDASATNIFRQITKEELIQKYNKLFGNK